MHISELIESYRAQQVGDGRSAHTTAQTARHGRLLVRWLGEQGHDGDVATIDHRTIAAFLGSKVVRETEDGAPRRPSSANAIRSSLRCMFGYAHAVGLTRVNAAGLVRRARCGPPVPKTLSADDQAALRAEWGSASTRAERRDGVLFELLLACGPRIGSVLRARVEDLNLADATLLLREMKNAREHLLYLPPHVVDLLRRHVEGRVDGWLFTGANGKPLTARQCARRLALACRRAGLARRASPHVMRHSFATALYARTNDLRLVGAALGHASMQSTMVYAAIDPRRLRSVVGG